MTPSETERRTLASNISVILEDSGDPTRPTVRVVDRGIGQHPADAHATLLSLNENNKVGKPHLQGAYGQGAAATYRFAKYTLIVTRRKPEETFRSENAGEAAMQQFPKLSRMKRLSGPIRKGHSRIIARAGKFFRID